MSGLKTHSVDWQDGRGRTLLHKAIEEGKKDVLVYLLNKGCNVNLADHRDITPLLLAARLGKIDLAALLLEKNAAKGSQQFQSEIVSLLVLFGAVDLVHKYFPTAPTGQQEKDLQLARSSKHLRIPPQQANTLDRKLLKAAEESPEEVESLLTQGARCDRGSITTFMHMAHEIFDIQFIEKLLETNPNMAVQDLDGNTPLHCLAASSLPPKIIVPLIKAYIKAGARVDAKNLEGKTPAMFMAGRVRKGCDPEVLRLLTPAVCLAARQKDPAPMQKLISQGESLNQQDYEGKSPLQIAIEYGNRPIFNLLLKNHADLFAADIFGRTAFQTAVQYGRTDMLTDLINSSRDTLNLKD